MKSLKAKSIAAINRRGCLLVYPLQNRKEPASLWSELYPRSKMRWEWDEGGDNRVSALWHLREQLSRSREVIYSKWFQGRATLFSKPVFTHMLAYLKTTEQFQDDSRRNPLGPQSQNIWELLRSDSPLSTKQIKAAAELEGRLLEPTYNRAMKTLWQRLLVVGFGEFEDSSFPSLGIGATQTLFEDLWQNALPISHSKAEAFLLRALGEDNPFWLFARRIYRDIPDFSEENLNI